MSLFGRSAPEPRDDAYRDWYVGVEDPLGKAEVLTALADELDRAPSYLTSDGYLSSPVLTAEQLRARADVAGERERSALTLVARELEAKKSKRSAMKPEGLRMRARVLRESSAPGQGQVSATTA